MNRTHSSFIAVLLTAGLLLVSACDTGFEEMNRNPTQANTISPDFLFTTAQLSTAGTRYEVWRANLIYASGMIQHLAHTWWAGDKYTRVEDWLTAFWNINYNGVGDNNRATVLILRDLIENNKDDPQQVNKVAAARIMLAYTFHRLTDVYGDIPYHEAGMGFLGDNVTPAYTPQDEIYADLLNELQESVASFDPAFPTYGSADLMYQGNIDQWRKFGNSLMLRVAMRLSKVDPAMAETWAQRAISGGLMESNADVAAVPHQTGPSIGPNGLNSNPVIDVFEVDQPKLTGTFVNWMKDRNDPRLPRLGAVYAGPASPRSTPMVTNDPEAMVGYPSGLNLTLAQDHPSWEAVQALEADYPELEDVGELNRYVQPHRNINSTRAMPTLLLTYAEVEFMQAEAAVRGWHSGDPQTHYENGVRAAMQQLTIYSEDAEIPDAEIDAYLDENPYDASRAIDQINSQYWAATFLNGIEAWSNWRRSGYPELTPANAPGNVTGGTIPRRLTYPNNEALLNEDNYQEAVARQGPDEMTTRVWWDIPQ
ncbi:MAG: SusD/RagB family nutrient-binding outer membrane lipoprotein [Rhodothermales bacterium]